MLKTSYTIVIDDREKKGFLFPEWLPILDPRRSPWTRTSLSVRLISCRLRLKAADYHLLGYEDQVVLEKKGSLDEIAKNVLTSKGRKNFLIELETLRDRCAHPYVIFSGSLDILLRPTDRNPQPFLAVDALFDCLLAYNIPFLCLPSGSIYQRRRLGEIAARLLVRGALRKR